MIDQILSEIMYVLQTNKIKARNGEPTTDHIEWLKAFSSGVRVVAHAVEKDVNELVGQIEWQLQHNDKLVARINELNSVKNGGKDERIG